MGLIFGAFGLSYALFELADGADGRSYRRSERAHPDRPDVVEVPLSSSRPHRRIC